MFEIQVIYSCSVVVDDNKLVDAAKLVDQRWVQIRLYLADEILRTQRLALTRLRICDSEI